MYFKLLAYHFLFPGVWGKKIFWGSQQMGSPNIRAMFQTWYISWIFSANVESSPSALYCFCLFLIDSSLALVISLTAENSAKVSSSINLNQDLLTYFKLAKLWQSRPIRIWYPILPNLRKISSFFFVIIFLLENQHSLIGWLVIGSIV